MMKGFWPSPRKAQHFRYNQLSLIAKVPSRLGGGTNSRIWKADVLLWGAFYFMAETHEQGFEIPCWERPKFIKLIFYNLEYWSYLDSNPDLPNANTPGRAPFDK